MFMSDIATILSFDPKQLISNDSPLYANAMPTRACGGRGINEYLGKYGDY